MKIVHCTSVHPSDDNRIFKMCRSLARSGQAVSFIVPTDSDQAMEGVSIKAVPVAATRLERMVRTTWRVYRRAVNERADVYQFHDPELIPMGLALRYLHKRNVIYDVHENAPEQILSKSYIPRPLRQLIASCCNLVEHEASKRLSAVVTANEDISQRFTNSKKIVAIHNYADSEEFSAFGINSHTSRYTSGLIFHSAASERTSFPAVLQALAILPKTLQFSLIATGSTPGEAREASETVRKLHCPHVQVAGAIPRYEMVRLMSECAISLVLYGEERNHASIRANRFFESLAAAAPVICPDFPEWRVAVESIGCGLAVNPRVPGEIAGAIEFLLEHPDEAAEMGRRGRQAFLDQFSWASETRRLLQLYEALVTARPGEGLPAELAA